MEDRCKAWAEKVDDWDYLLDSIRKNKCVLFLGPDLASTSSGKSFYEELAGLIPAELKEKVLYHNRDQFFFFRDLSTKNTFYNKFQHFHAAMQPGPILAQVAEIPFHLILSTSPDTLILKAFQGYGYNFQYYERVGAELMAGQVNADQPLKWKPLSPPTPNRPLIYNLFGNIDSAESLVLAHDDIFDFTITLLSNQNIPTLIEKEIQSANILLFLGFGLQKWYIKLLLKLFKLDKNLAAVKYAVGKEPEQPPAPLAPELEELARQLRNSHAFCENHLRIRFLDGEAAEFVHCLRQAFPTADRRQPLPTSEIETVNPLERIKGGVKKLVADDELKKALGTLIRHFEEINEEDGKNDAYLLKSRLQKAKKDHIIKGTLDRAQFLLETNRIRDGILLILDELPETGGA